jgi:hypothetical protein
VENFEKLLKSHEAGYDGMQAQSDAMVLYDKYVYIFIYTYIVDTVKPALVTTSIKQ